MSMPISSAAFVDGNSLSSDDFDGLNSNVSKLPLRMPGLVKPFVDAGFAIHWLKPNSKMPIGDDWQNKPIATFESLRRRYSPRNNVGVRLGEISRVMGGYLHVFDVDIRKPALAAGAWAALDRLFPGVDFTSHPSVISGSGGESRHVYFVTDHPFKSRKLAKSDTFEMVFDPQKGRDVRKNDWEVELFGGPKQVAMPPSIHPDTGQPYQWEREFDFDGFDTPFIPSAAVEAAGASLDVDDRTEVNDQPLDLTLDQGRDILARLPLDEWCEDREGWTKVGMALKHEFGEDGYDLWTEFSEQSAKFDAKNQAAVWKSFKGKTKRPIRMATLQAAAGDPALVDEFDDIRDDEDDGFDTLLKPVGKTDRCGGSPIAKWVADLNNRHAVAFVEGKCVVLTHKPDGATAYGSVADLNNFYDNQRRPTKNASEPVTRAWMRHSARASYPNGITFQPNRNPEGAFNLWSGFSVEPDPTKSCCRFLAHLRDTICGGNDVAYQWLVRWFAHMIQRPEEKPGTAVVLKGSKGVGKDTVGDYVGGLFPRHHTKIANADHLVGRFNANHEKTLLLHVEEGFWAGDHKAEGSLKYIITSPQVQIERKGIDAFQVPSVLRVFVSSNEAWVVPASFDERRFFVLNITGKKREPAYFEALHKEVLAGGRAALLHHLQHLDLSDFDVRNPPMTEGLRDQKLESLRSVDRWWFEVLAAGDLPCPPANAFDDGNACDWSTATLLDRTPLRARYSAWAKDQRAEWRPLGDAAFGKKLADLIPSLQIRRVSVAGQIGRPRQYELPPLAVCRSEFEAWLGLPVDWEQDH